MTYSNAKMHSFCTATGDASFAARFAVILLFVLDIAIAVSIFAVVLSRVSLIGLLVILAILVILALLLLVGLPMDRRKNRLR